MTKKEAIKLAIKACEETWNEKTCKQIGEVLEQEPCNTDTCKVVKAYMNEWDKPNNSDTISRQAVLMSFQGFRDDDMINAWLIKKIIKDQPSVEQQICDDEYIKVPKKVLKYRTAGMVAYNVEWLKNNFDIERAVICGEQELKTRYISIDDVMSVFDDFMCGEDEKSETFLEMLKDKLAGSEEGEE